METAVAPGHCLETSELLALVEPGCDDDVRAAALAHAATCESCRQAIAGVARAVRSELGTPTGASPRRTDDIDADPPSTLGRHRIVRVIGRGAMGTVYEAFDPLLRRSVAIKQLHHSSELGPRLRREARTLARLADPHVVAVLETGLDWIAMELVLGATLATWQRGRSWREVVDAYLQAAHGLAAAHALDVVHRDFKPSNVLVDHDGRVRVADFGLAAAVEPAKSGLDTVTLEGSSASGLVGTPAYMAPEQLLGRRADARSDQFAFCVALWEALAGMRPFAGADVIGLCATVLAGRVRPRPRSRVPPAIWQVLERGLAVAPAERWPSMHALADALARARASRRGPVLALGCTLGAVGLAVIAGFADVSPCARQGASASVWNAERARAMSTALVESGLPYGRATAEAVTRELDAYDERWLATRAELCGLAAPDPAALACLDDRLVALDELARSIESGERDAVLGAARAVQALPPPSLCAGATGPIERSPEARELSQQLVRERTTLPLRSDDDDLPRLERLLARAEALGDPATIADALTLLGVAQAMRGRWELAMVTLEDAYFRSYEVGDDLAAADAASDLALGASWAGRRDEALRWARLAAARAVDDQQRASVASIEAQVLFELGRPDEAEQALAQATGDAIPGQTRAAALTMLAQIHASAGRLDEAETRLLAAIAALEHDGGAAHPELSRPLNLLGVVQIQRGELRKAIVTLARARDLVIVQLGEHHPLVAYVLGNLAVAQGDLGDREGAYQSLLVVLDSFEKSGADDPLRLSITLHNLAKQALLADRPADALRHATRVLELDRELGNDDGMMLSLGFIARARRSTGDAEGAMQAWAELVALRTASAEPDVDELGWAELEAAITALDAGWTERAEPHVARALQHYAASRETSSVERARAECTAARIRRGDRALVHLRRAAELLRDETPHERRSAAWLELAATWTLLGADAFAPWHDIVT